MTTQPLLVTFLATDILESHDVAYCLVGSLATSAVGIMLGHRLFDQEEFKRRVRRRLSSESERELTMATPEDLVLSKLEWYELGHRVSERQWRDLLGILRVQTALDWEYLEKWAKTLGLLELLKKAQGEVSKPGA